MTQGARQSITTAYLIGKLGYTPENLANKGVAGGYAALDGSGHLATSYLTAGILNTIYGYTPLNPASTSSLVLAVSSPGSTISALTLQNSSTTGTGVQMPFQAVTTTSISNNMALIQATKIGAWDGTANGYRSALAFSVNHGTSGIANEVMRLLGNGQRMLIATTTDDGANTLQVNGSAKVTGAFQSTGILTLGSNSTVVSNAAGNLLASVLVGTLSDGRLSANVPLLNVANAFKIGSASDADIMQFHNTNTTTTGTAGLGLVLYDTSSGANYGARMVALKVGAWDTTQPGYTSALAIQVNQGSNSGTINEVARFLGNGRVLIGTTTDDGSHALQVNGGLTSTTATYTGLLLTAASATGGAGFRLAAGADPTTPTNGDLWVTTGGALKVHLAGTKRSVITDTGGTVSNLTARTDIGADIAMLFVQNLSSSTSAGAGLFFDLGDSGGTIGGNRGKIHLVKLGAWTAGTQSTQTSALIFEIPDGATQREVQRFVAGGRVLIGTTTDDGSSLLQVNGATKITGILTLGSTPMAVSNSAGNLLSSALTGALPAIDGSALTNVPYDLVVGYEGKPTASVSIYIEKAGRAFTILSGTHQGTAKVAATASTIFTVKKNGTSIGTVTWAAAGTTPTFSITQTAFAVGDILEVVSPAQDATLADIGITFLRRL